MEEPNSSNLPVKVKEKGVLANHPALARTTDALRRIGKIAGAGVITIAGMGLLSSSIVPVSIVGLGVLIGGASRVAQNINMKTEPNLLFGAKKVKDEISIFQDPLNMNLMSRMVGYDEMERMSMMGLQTLVGLSRYKEILKDTPFEVDEKGQKIYSQKFSTVTHGINLRSLKYLEDLGYVKVDSIDSKFEGKTIDEKLTARKGKDGVVKSYLLFEKIGFGNWKGARAAISAMVSGDEKQKDANKKVMEKATFRLTDKPLDFDEIKSFSKPAYRKSLPKEKKEAANWLGMMARKMERRKIEIGQDAFGRPTLKYPSRAENAKINAEKKAVQNEKTERTKGLKLKQLFEKEKEKFNKKLRDGVEQPTVGKTIEQEDVFQEATKQENKQIRTENDDFQL